MARLPKEISDFMASYSVDADEIWEVRGGAFAIKHKALERVAVEQGIQFEPPQVLAIDLKEKLVAVAVTGSIPYPEAKDRRREWSTGEAAPYNNKNGYPLAMAEKRARDRVTLKLLNTHGALYSEEEAEDFKRPNPHVTRPEDVIEPIERDQYGEPIDNIPHGDPSIETLPKKDARKDWSLCEQEIRKITTLRGLQNWAETNKNRVASFPSDWAEMLRGTYRDQMNEVRAKQEAA